MDGERSTTAAIEDQVPATPPVVHRQRSKTVAVAVIVVMAALAAIALQYFPGLRSQAALFTVAPSAAPAPVDAGPWTDVNDVQDSLDRQGEALITGDAAGWLELLDPANTALVKQFQGYYEVLRALQVTQWYANPDDSIFAVLAADAPPRGFTVDVFFGYCWQSKICPPVANRNSFTVDGFVAEVSWKLADDRYVISKVTLPSKLPWYTNHPWLKTTMRSTVQGSVTVFASASSKVDLADVAKRAEAAATKVGSYGRWIKPDRFVIYVANEPEWKKWFGGPPGVNVIGVAIPTSMNSISIVLRTKEFSDSSLDHLLRHELGHVVTLLGSSGRGPEYLIEGIAEWIASDGEKVSSYDRLENVRRYFRSGKWKGDLDALDPYADDALAGSAAYGGGYLTWKCIETKYGLEKMWGFATIALRENDGAVKGAPGQLGVPWSTVKKQCVEYIKSVY